MLIISSEIVSNYYWHARIKVVDSAKHKVRKYLLNSFHLRWFGAINTLKRKIYKAFNISEVCILLQTITFVK